jgi:hypothetical protein
MPQIPVEESSKARRKREKLIEASSSTDSRAAFSAIAEAVVLQGNVSNLSSRRATDWRQPEAANPSGRPGR